ncbi:TRAP transporter substrate-binding protein DctP [Clostridium magnum]|uniref:TRAP transporter substrate-binding protein DctP n=1 Tax=Clostridium magnum TaxID=33954 RepID=UPI001587FF6C|nr:TRAP transporter substrate-binding protein DctP [Clostridium magnum]
MKNFKKTGLLMLVIILTTSLFFGCGSKKKSKDNVTWKLGYIRPEGTRTDTSAKNFAADVEKQTEGRVKIELYPNSELGDYSLVQERVGMGDVQMQLASVGQTVDKTLGIQTAPYIVSNWKEARKLYNSKTGVIANYVAERLDKQNIKLLAVYPQYFGSVALSKEPKNPKDPSSSKNLKIRVPSTKAWEELGKGLGFMTTPLPASEIFTSLQTGIVDGAIGAGSESYYTQYKELVKYVMPIKYHFECHWLYINKDTWNELSEDDQKSIQAIAEKIEKDAFDQAEKEEKKYDDLFKKEGTTVYDFTDDEIKAYADKIRKDVWPKLESEYGKDIFDKVKKEVGSN